MKLGADRKKIVVLEVLFALMPLAYWYANSSDDSAPVSAVRLPPAAAAQAVHPNAPSAKRRRTANRAALGELKVKLGSTNPEDRPDPATIDPTLRLDLLAKVQNVEAGSPGRNLFQFGTAPPPPAPKIEVPKNVPGIAINKPPVNPMPAGPVGPPPAPAAPQMTFKYYGYQVSKSDGHKAAFLLDGEDILIAGENDTVKRRYRVVKIGLGSIVIEDTQFKSTQTLPLQENVGV